MRAPTLHAAARLTHASLAAALVALVGASASAQVVGWGDATYSACIPPQRSVIAFRQIAAGQDHTIALRRADQPLFASPVPPDQGCGIAGFVLFEIATPDFTAVARPNGNQAAVARRGEPFPRFL